MKNVRCVYCISYDDGKCKIKKVSVSANKKRKCDLYKRNEDLKVKTGTPIPSTRVPHPSIAKELRHKARKLAKLEKLKNQHGTEKHPLTGNLDAFKTTASEE